MRAEQPHRLPGRRPHRRQAEPLDQALDDGLRRLAGMDDARVMPSVQAEAETRKASERARPATSRRPRACPRSAGRRWRRPAPAAAPRPAPSGRGPPWSTANRRAGNPRSRRARRRGRGWSRPAAGRGRRCGPRRRSPRGAAASKRGRERLVRRRIGRAKAGSAGSLGRRGLRRPVHRTPPDRLIADSSLAAPCWRALPSCGGRCWHAGCAEMPRAMAASWPATPSCLALSFGMFFAEQQRTCARRHAPSARCRQ